MATLASITQKVTPAPQETPFATTPLGIATNTVLGIPSAFISTVKNIAQGFARDIASAGLTIAKPLGGSPTLQPSDIQNPFGKALFTAAFGDKPINAIEDNIANAEQQIKQSPFAKAIGADKHALPLAFAGIMGGEALDFVPFGGYEKNAVRELINAKTIEQAGTVLQKMGLTPEAVDIFAPRFSAATTKEAVQGEMGLLKSVIGLKAVTGEGNQLVRTGAEASTQALETTAAQEGKAIPPATASELPSAVKAGQEAKATARTISESLPPQVASKVSDVTDFVNLSRMNIDEAAATKILNTIQDIKPELEKIKGGTLTNAEVVKAATQSEVLSKVVSKESTLTQEAALLKTRQQLAALAKGEGVSEDFIKTLQIVSSEATSRGRQLQALSIGADPILSDMKTQVVKSLLDFGVDAEKVIEAAKGVDFNNPSAVTKFYRQFVPASFFDKLNEYRYINLLSSPKTHIINAFSNLVQTVVLNPATRLATGAVDFVGAALTGKQREVYASEVGPYVRGTLNAVPDAVNSFLKAVKGNVFIERPDVSRIPSGSSLLRPFQVIPRLLEGGDIFFRTLLTNGERQALAYRATKAGKDLSEVELAKIEVQAKKNAAYYIFRNELDPANKSGQGHLLAGIDQLTSAIYVLRKVPGIKWFLPFVQTPMNILKQGIEYSPLGIATLPGAANKAEQIGKTMIGSVVFLGAASLGLQGRLTWAVPSNAKEKDAFYNSGRQPYSVRIGNQWVSYSKLGPLAYPLAMASAMQWYLNENPQAATQNSLEKSVSLFNGIAQFFSDQSYVQGIQSLVQLASGGVSVSGTGAQNVFSGLAGQVVPLSSLQRWITQIIDPVYRKPDTALNVTDLVQSVTKDIPFLSTSVPAIPGSLGRPNPITNAVSPLSTSTVRPRFENILQNIRRQQTVSARAKAIQNKAKGGHASLGSVLK